MKFEFAKNDLNVAGTVTSILFANLAKKFDLKEVFSAKGPCKYKCESFSYKTDGETITIKIPDETFMASAMVSSLGGIINSAITNPAADKVVEDFVKFMRRKRRFNKGYEPTDDDGGDVVYENLNAKKYGKQKKAKKSKIDMIKDIGDQVEAADAAEAEAKKAKKKKVADVSEPDPVEEPKAEPQQKQDQPKKDYPAKKKKKSNKAPQSPAEDKK